MGAAGPLKHVRGQNGMHPFNFLETVAAQHPDRILRPTGKADVPAYLQKSAVEVYMRTTNFASRANFGHIVIR